MAGSVTAPKIEIEIAACEFSLWRRFAPYHYLTADLARSARTFAAYVNGEPIAFTGILFRPVSKSQRTGQNLMSVSRVVTLPDWQGIGAAFVLVETVAAAYKAVGRRLNNYPAHPSFIRSHDRSPRWKLLSRPGFSMSQRGGTDAARRRKVAEGKAQHVVDWKHGGRPCATFGYRGPALDLGDAQRLLAPYLKG